MIKKIKSVSFVILFLIFVPIVFSQDLCGNGLIEPGENCGNCKDAVCLIEQACKNGVCINTYYYARIVITIILLALLTPGIIYLLRLGLIKLVKEKYFNLTKRNIILLSASILFLMFSLFLLYSKFTVVSFSLSTSNIDPFATVIVKQDMADKLDSFFAENNTEERVFCLKGRYKDGKYQVYKLKEPRIIAKQKFSVAYKPCSKYNNLGTIHTHREGDCKLSNRDLYTFGKKGDILTGVVCGKDNFAFFNQIVLTDRMFFVLR